MIIADGFGKVGFSIMYCERCSTSTSRKFDDQRFRETSAMLFQSLHSPAKAYIPAPARHICTRSPSMMNRASQRE